MIFKIGQSGVQSSNGIVLHLMQPWIVDLTIDEEISSHALLLNRKQRHRYIRTLHKILLKREIVNVCVKQRVSQAAMDATVNGRSLY